jgi:hypothetical protein
VALAAIIRQIYEGTNNFEKSKVDIEVSIGQLIGYDKFHVFVNELIKIQVKVDCIYLRACNSKSTSSYRASISRTKPSLLRRTKVSTSS